MAATTELVPSISIANLLSQREGVREALERSRSELVTASRLLSAITIDRPVFTHGIANLVCDRDAHGFHLLADDGVDYAMKRFDAAAWRHLLSASGLRSMMDARARAEWERQLEKLDVPPLTREVIESTFAQLHAERGEMFDRGVIRCFKGLAWDYKTNLPQKFGKRIVMRYLTGMGSSFDKTNALDDLMRVMSILDGRPEPDHRGGVYRLLSDAGLTSSLYARAGEVRNEYMRIKVFKNHNGHVEFLRPDLVERMNQILARHFPGALPAPEGTPRGHESRYVPPEISTPGLDFFRTPPELAQMIVTLARIQPGDRVLEPSAGEGDLARVAAAAGGAVECFELDQERREGLLRAGLRVRGIDFLQEPEPYYGETARQFDVVVMNPPFSQRLDVHHVRHAIQFLRPGGRLVAVMSAGVLFREDGATCEFRGIVNRLDGTFRQLPADTFKASGTSVNTCLLVLQTEESRR